MAVEISGVADAVPTQLYVGGKWLPSSDGSTVQVLDPSSGMVIADVANATVEDGLAAVSAAADAAAEWASTAPRRRAEILRRMFELMTRRQHDLAWLISSENGKALPDAKAEVGYAAEFFRWYAEEAVRLIGQLQTAPSGGNRILVVHQPVGVAVLVTPWNFPAAMATRKIGPALAAGCTVVLKPATDTPLTALTLAALGEEAGIPPGVVNVVPSNRSGAVVSAMLHDPRVRKLSFTGSTEVGRLLLREASDAVVNCSMELGGNAPFIVFADADIDAAVDGALVAKMRNAGEACTAANRFYVARPVADEFADKLARRMADMRVGPAVATDTQVGPLVNAVTREKVAELVNDATAKGAVVMTGGHVVNAPGFFYQPTVLRSIPADAALLSEEIFGPVAPIIEFDDEAEAIALANNTEYGLVAYVYTRDLARGLRVCEALESGMVGLNRGLVSDPAAPFGGVKQSGIGREGGHDGLLEFTETKYIATSW